MKKKCFLILMLCLLGVAEATRTQAQAPFFTEDFEGDVSAWTLVNGDQTNKWVIGSAVAAGGSAKSAYISDNGTDYHYNNNATSVVHLYRDITFPTTIADEDLFEISFDWQGVGETGYDDLRVYLVETTVTPVAGTSLSVGLLGTFVNQSSWTNGKVSIPASYAGTTKRLVFTWRNDFSYGDQPTIAIDNIAGDIFTFIEGDESISFSWKTLNYSKYIYITSTLGKEFKIDWGDGAIGFYTGTGSSMNITHSYSGLDFATVTVTSGEDCYFQSLTISGGNVYSLDVSNANSLTQLTCSGNQLTSLDLSSNTALRTLYCDNNNLSGLDVSNNTLLTSLYCSNNAIPLADLYAISQLKTYYGTFGMQTLSSEVVALGEPVSTNSKFGGVDPVFTVSKLGSDAAAGTDYSTNGDNITFLTPGIYTVVVTNSAIGYSARAVNTCIAGDVEIQQISFTIDLNHNNYYYDFYIDLSLGKELTVDWGDGNESAVTEEGYISHEYKNSGVYTVTITSKTTDCMILSLELSSSVTSLDVSKAIALFDLYCNYNQLTSLDVSNNTELLYLYCNYNQLTSLDVSNNKKLSFLHCNYNQLTSLNVSNNAALTNLYCYYNQLTNLDVSNNAALYSLECSNNQLTSLDLSNNPSLRNLYCANNAISLEDIYDISQIGYIWYKYLSPQILPIKEISAGGTVTVDPVFNGAGTNFIVKNMDLPATLGTDYTVSGGDITFVTPGLYTVEITNPAFTDDNYPPEVKVVDNYIIGNVEIPNVAVPFSEDFEGDISSSWLIFNGTQTNQWVTGTATAKSGSKSAYISDDGGVTNHSSYVTSIVHLFRKVTFTSSTIGYQLSFDWKGDGYTNIDELMVYLADPNILPLSGFQLAATPLGRYTWQDNWQHVTIDIPASYSGTEKLLVLTWRNEYNVFQPPVAIDNVSIKYSSALSISQGNLTYGSTPSPTVSKTGDGTVSLQYKVKNAADATYSATVPTNTGDYTVRGIIAETANYTEAISAPIDFTISKKALTVTADDKTKAYGAALPTWSISYSGWANSETAAVLTTAPTATTTATATSNAGTYPITVSGAAADNYTFNYVSGTLTVSKAPLTVTADNKTKAYGAALPVFTVSYSGFVNSETSAVITTAPTASTAATATSPRGTYPITVSGGTATNYAFTYEAGTLTVQSIDADLVDLEISTGVLSPAFSADVTSYTVTLPCGTTNLTFDATAPAYGSKIFGNTTGELVFSAPGRQTLVIQSIAEDGVTTKEYTVTVNLSYPTALIRRYWNDVLGVNINAANNGGHTFTSYQWTRDGQPLSGETKPYLNLDNKPAGVYNVLLTKANGEPVSVCEGVTITSSRGLKVYPNPAGATATVENSEWETVNRLQLFDLSGRLVREYPAGSSKTSIDVSDLPEGIYLLKAGDQTTKLIKN